MTIVAYSTVPSNNDSLAPEGTMVVSALNDAIRGVAADVRGFGNELCWYQYGDGNGPLAAERVLSTRFRVGADLRAVYAVGQRVRAVGSQTGDITGVIVSNSFSSPYTIVNVEWDSGALAAEALTMYVSAVRPQHLPALAGRPLNLTDSKERIEGAVDATDIYSGSERIGRFTPTSLDLLSNDGSGDTLPRLRLLRRSPSPEAFDSLGGIDFFGHDAALTDQVYARMFARPSNVTTGAHEGIYDFSIAVAGTLARILRMRPGVVLVNKTFSDEQTSGGVELHSDGDVWARDATLRGLTTNTATLGAASATSVTATTVTASNVNASGNVRVAGDPVAVLKKSANVTISGTQMTAAHGLDSQPALVDYRLKCVIPEHGYSASNETRTAWQTDADNSEGATVWADNANVGLSIVQAGRLRVVPKAGSEQPRLITPANWRVVFVYGG